MHGTILLGYFPVPKFDCFSEKVRSLAKYQAFHTCVRIILESLYQLDTSGIEMTCADRLVRRVLPILAAYVADYPEQCLVAVCMENRCPTDEVQPNERGSHQCNAPRDQQEILELLGAHHRGELSSHARTRFEELGLRAIHEPFWKGLPFTNIFTCFTPDLLHQLHKGVFKDHLVKWCTAILGKNELDERFRCIPMLSGLKHFKNGISGVSQWTGHEHKQMERVWVGRSCE